MEGAAFKFCPTMFDADSTGSISGSFALVTGVGTAMMTKSASLIHEGSVVSSMLFPGAIQFPFHHFFCKFFAQIASLSPGASSPAARSSAPGMIRTRS